MSFILRILGLLLRWSIYVVVALVALLLLLYGAVLFANRNDDPLDAAVEAVLKESPPQIDPERNGYFAWIGVMGPASVPPHEWGRRWYQEVLAIDATARPKGPAPAPVIEAGLRKDAWPKGGPCQRVDTCLDDVAADPAGTRALLEKAQVTLERADAAIAFPEAQEPARPDFGMTSPIPRHPRGWPATSGARFALDVAEGRHEAALARLAREQRFHAAQAVGAVSLIEKVIAYSYLKNDYLLLAQYLRRHPQPASAQTATIDAILAPLPEPALSMQAPLRFEARAAMRLLLNLSEPDVNDLSDSIIGQLGNRLGEPGRRALSPLYLPQATANELFASYARSAEADALDGGEYRAALAAVRREMESAASTFNVLRLRNPVGRVLSAVATPDHHRYLFLRDDLRVLQAALAHRHRLLSEGRPLSDMASQLAQSDLVHPYTGESPRWDEAKQALVYAASNMRRNKEALAIKM